MKAIIEKYTHDGALNIRYDGVLLAQDETRLVFQGYFAFDVPRDYVQFRRGDRSVETFYTDRWYNIVELHDVDDDRLKGWYCNIARPPRITHTADAVIIAYDDLALDAFIAPDGNLLVLDEDELDALQLDAETLARVWSAVELLREHAARREAPFNQIQV